MATRIAILDLGTNTFHLLIADIKGTESPKIVHHETIAVKLGEGGITKGHISAEAFTRGINALKKFRKVIDDNEVVQIRSAATSAIRSASNGIEFIEKVKAETGIELEIINGDQEAILIYQGVRAAINMDQACLIVDIGGGSVELIICDKYKIFWKKSYPLGAARLMAQFHHSDPISEKEIKSLNDYLDSVLADLKQQLNMYNPAVMIGSAGAFETFAELQDPEFKPSFINSEFLLDLKRFDLISAGIIRSTHAERTEIPRIIPVRVDMIVVAALLTRYLLNISDVKVLKLSTYSLKEGILFGAIK